MANASPALTGLPVLYGADIYQQDTTKKFPLGATGHAFGGNKVYRYGRNNASTAAVAGNVQTMAAIEANHENQLVDVSAAIDAYQVTVNVGATAAAKDLYAEGEFCVNDATGEGISYRVLGNAAISSSGTGLIYLAEPLQVALTLDVSEFTLKRNLYDRFLIGADQTLQAVGIANKAIAVDLYAWLQTRGLCATLADETIAVGSGVVIGSSLDGSVETADTDDVVPFIGIATQAAVDTEHRLIYLTID